MALTPEDVLKKSFNATQFRRGYDEREVDDFLDEVVAELRGLIAERDDYKRKYEESVKRGGGAVVTKVDDERVAAQAKQIKDLQRQLAAAKSGAASVTPAPVADASAAGSAELDAVRADLAAKEAELEQVRADLEAARRAPAKADVTDDATKAAGVLAMAQQLHDQLVAKGEAEKSRLVGEGSAERERLLAEGQQRHKALITEATTQHEALLADANAKRQQVLAGLEDQRTGLEREIATLRSFESKYKQQLVGFLEGKLHEAKNTGSLEPKD